MAYKIQYTPQDNGRYPEHIKRQRTKWGRGVIACLVIAVVLWFAANGIPELLIPLNVEITKSAAEEMVETVRQGESIERAVLVFCRQIIDGKVE